MRHFLNFCAICAVAICSLASCGKNDLTPIITPGTEEVGATQPFVVSIYVDDEVGLDSTTFSFFDDEGVSEFGDGGAISTRTVSSDQWESGVVEITVLSSKEPAFLQTPNGEGDGIYPITKEALRTKAGVREYVHVKLVQR